MAEVLFNIDDTQLLRFNKKLRNMHRAAFPTAVRSTLNDAAFDVKSVTMPKEFQNQFTIRNRTFLSSHSGVTKAAGWDIASMESHAGIMPRGSTSAEELRHQELGGKEQKTAIYLTTARTSRSNARGVRKENYLQKKMYVRGDPNNSGRTRKSNFVAAAVMAQKLNTFVLWRSSTGSTAFLIKGIDFSSQGRHRKVKINAIPIADIESDRNITISKRAFLVPASLKTQRKMNAYFIKNAEYAITKYMNR